MSEPEAGAGERDPALSERPRRERRPQLLMCRTCPRYQPSPGRAPGDGAQLADRVMGMLRQLPFAKTLVMAPTSCLGGCRSPCNLSLSIPDRPGLRLTRLALDDAQAVVAAVAMALAAEEGGVRREQLPESLRDKLLARPGSF